MEDFELKYNKRKYKSLEILDSVSDEDFKRIAFEIECKYAGIDPNHPESHKRLKKIKRRNKWKYEIWPTIRNTCDWLFMAYCFFAAGRNFANDLPWWAVVIALLGGLGWLNIFLTHKFGSDYIFRY